MQCLNGGYSPGFLPATSQNTFFDDWTTQMAISEASRRLSRGANGQRTGSAMRVVKHSSANNSPRASMGPSRRGITVNGRPQQDQQMRRPVSWQPNSYLYTPPTYINQQQSCYPMSTPNMYDQDMESAYPQLSPMMTSYSTNVSPCSSFSPLPLDYQPAAPQYLSPQRWEQQRPAPYFPQPDAGLMYTEAPPSLTHAPSLDTPAPTSASWNPYMNTAGNTTPPTPESFVQQSQPAVSGDAYQPMEEQEEEGEILVGMGLYDTPEKYEEDPQLNNYRSTVSSLLGSNLRPLENTGKGLTLEQAWEPPKSDDEDDAEDEDATA